MSYTRLLVLNLMVPPGSDSRILRSRISIVPVVYDGEDRYYLFYQNIIDEDQVRRYTIHFEHVIICVNHRIGSLLNQVEVRYPRDIDNEISKKSALYQIDPKQIKVFSIFKTGIDNERLVECFDLIFCKEYLGSIR